MKRNLLITVALCAASMAASTAFADDAVQVRTVPRPDPQPLAMLPQADINNLCVQSTGSHLRPHDDGCLAVNGRSATTEALMAHGAISFKQALRENGT